MPITLYHYAPSAPSRGALLAARAVGIDFVIEEVNLLEKAHLKPEFVKLNPQHTVPTLDDNGFVLWESRAIAGYLVDTYAKNDTLYPKDTKKRALVDQRLYFDLGTLYPRIRAICYPVIFLGETLISDDKKKSLEDAFQFLDQFLENQDWVAGDHLTIGDIACVTSVSSIQAVGWDVTKYKNIPGWLKRCADTIPSYEENQNGADFFGEYVRSKLTPGQL